MNNQKDFNADQTNDYTAKGSFASGSSAGIELGVSSVQKLTRGALQPQQKSDGVNFKRNGADEAVKTADKGTFTWKA
jgi:hypothetical protein